MRVIAILFFLLSIFSTQSFALDQFQSEQAAQKHCPSDTVIWINLPTGVFHFKGQRCYSSIEPTAIGKLV